ncbi:hypothetical protein PENSPDRAFT_442235 [Peniophora sp. CONT]|nr:hypothetical protein PENSPDRAFT_442235 [Peniophora sp. CONT]
MEGAGPATRPDFTLTLPFELLCDIFSTLVHDDPARLLDKSDSPSDDDSQLPYNGHIRGWFVVTHVCSRWRKIAIGQPALWAHIDVRIGADWVKRFIKRSRPLPITFEAFCEDATTGSPVATYNARRYGYYHSLARIREQVCRDTMRAHGDRMRQLDIRWGVNVRGRTVPSTIKRSFPVLDTLLMRDCGLGLPLSEVFAFDAPGLRRLCVQDVTSFPWDLPSFSHLTHLVLECVSAFGFGGSGFFFDILRRNGALQQLCLGGVIPTQDHISERTVDLPHLSSLCLSGTADRVSTFRASLRTPALRSDELKHLCILFHPPLHHPQSCELS